MPVGYWLVWYIGSGSGRLSANFREEYHADGGRRSIMERALQAIS